MIVTSSYDSLLRRSSLSGATVSVAYSYDAASRLSAVTNGTYTAGYVYLPNSPLVSNIVFNSGSITRMTTTKTWDSPNRLTKIDSRTGVSPVAVFDYQYNDANQRTRRTNEDGSYWDSTYGALADCSIRMVSHHGSRLVLAGTGARSVPELAGRQETARVAERQTQRT